MSRPDDQDCATCRFWDNIPSGTGGQGHCKRRAPVIYSATYVDGLDRVQSEAHRDWPVTGEADWCGEFERPPGEHFEGGLRVTTYKCAHCCDGSISVLDMTPEGLCPSCGADVMPF